MKTNQYFRSHRLAITIVVLCLVFLPPFCAVEGAWATTNDIAVPSQDFGIVGIVALSSWDSNLARWAKSLGADVVASVSAYDIPNFSSTHLQLRSAIVPSRDLSLVTQHVRLQI